MAHPLLNLKCGSRITRHRTAAEKLTRTRSLKNLGSSDKEQREVDNMHRTWPKQKRGLLLFAVSALSTLSGHIYADGYSGNGTTSQFTLNFTPKRSMAYGEDIFHFSCNRPDSFGEDCDKNDEFRGNNGSDRTPFAMEVLRADGAQWWHVIIGLPGQSFVQESYIKTRSGTAGNDDQGPISDGIGSTSNNFGSINANDPRGPATFSGSGTGNPKSTMFRQLLNSQGMVQDLTKASFTQKHKLAQTMTGQNADINFVMDMTNSNFDTATTPGNMTNKLTVNDAGFNDIPAFPDNFPSTTTPPDSQQFDVALDGSNVHVTGGTYRYVSWGQYEGEGKGFDVFAYDWDKPVDPAQNAGHLYGGSGKD